MMEASGKTKLKDMTIEERKQYERNRKKLQRQNAKNIAAKNTNVNKVTGLKYNSGDNVCFGNVVIQLLYHLPGFRLELANTRLLSSCVLNLRELFAKINTAGCAVRPTPYFHVMDIPRYIPHQQYDSHEFLTYILGQVYQDVNNGSCIFTVILASCLSTCVCGRTPSSLRVNTTFLTLNVHAISAVQLVSELLREYFAPTLVQYTCESCKRQGGYVKTSVLENCPDMLLIQLSIFDGHGQKIKPSLSIDQELTDFGLSLELYGIIYHIGNTIQSGHYTCSVKVDATWYFINDSIVHQKHPKLSCFLNETTVPYILMYKKKDVFTVENAGPSCSSHTDPEQVHVTGAEMSGTMKEPSCQAKRARNTAEMEKEVEEPEKKTRMGGSLDSQLNLATPSERMKKMRSKQSQAEKKKENEKNKASMASLRANLCQDDREKENEKSKGRMAASRINLSQADKEKVNEKYKEDFMRFNYDEHIPM